MMRKSVKISIITVVFNGADVIEQTIRSVIEQDYDDYEYIIIDGGSTDGTTDIIKKFDKSISYWVSEPDRGIYDAMNKGLSYASGEVVNFMNAGDFFYDTNSLNKINDRFLEFTNADIIIAKELIDGKVCKTYLDGTSSSVYYGNFFPHQATFSRTRLYKEYGKFNEEYGICADFDWILGAYFKGYKLQWCDDVVAVYDPNGVSSSGESIYEQFLISSKYIELSGETDLIEKAGKYYLKVYCRAFVGNLIKENKSNTQIKEALLKLTQGRAIDVWGSGLIGSRMVSFLDANGMEIKHILDSDVSKQGLSLGSIKIVGINDVEDELIIVSTAYYEKEIEGILKGLGLREHEDYITYTNFCMCIVKNLEEKGYDVGDPYRFLAKYEF